MNSENPRDLRKNWFPTLNLNSTVGLAKLIASFLTNLRSFESLENLLLLAVESFGDLQTYREKGYRKRNWFKIIHPKWLSTPHCTNSTLVTKEAPEETRRWKRGMNAQLEGNTAYLFLLKLSQVKI